MIAKPENAKLIWDENDQPISESFDDVYFSKVSGLEETRFVFLGHNHLPERFAKLPPKDTFVIGETGFGTGLNLLCAWQLFERTAHKTCQLHFVSVEKFPLTKTDLQKALALWPELSVFADALIEQYPESFHSPFYRLKLADNIHLTLIIDDASEGFNQLTQTDHPQLLQHNTKIDAWFLDGFAPSKNPEMWSDALFNAIHKLSDKRTSAATFTCAGVVKRGLKSAGFQLEKVPGFGRKREMLRAHFNKDALQTTEYKQTPNNRPSPYQATWSVSQKAQTPNKSALIIGAGLAGCHTARVLAERGFSVTVLERHEKPALEASGNPQGVLYAKLSAKSEKLSDFNLSALEYAQTFYRSYFSQSSPDTEEGYGQACGVIQLATNEKTQKLHEQIAQVFANCSWLQPVNAEHASNIAGTTQTYGGLYFSQSGWLNPARICQDLLNHPNINSHYRCDITQLESVTQQSGPISAPYWQASTLQDSYQADLCILACANEASRFEQTQHLPHKAIRGQVSYLNSSLISKRLKTVLCAGGYLAPADKDQHCLGASFNLKRQDLELDVNEHLSNLEHLDDFGSELCQTLRPSSPEQLEGRVALRCTTPDYLPQVGPISEIDALNHHYGPLKHNARADIARAGANQANLYACFGFGSRGLCYSPIAAEILCSYITASPMPVTQALASALHPSRFAIRQLIRNKN